MVPQGRNLRPSPQRLLGIIRPRMKSPFPGMDPYLESHWLDVHSSLVTSARDALNEQLPDDLVASVEERIAVESEGGTDRLISPDVRVFEPERQGPTVVNGPCGLVEAP